jgi:hypothetical protein
MNVLAVLSKYYSNESYCANETEIVSWIGTQPTEEELQAKWEEMKDEYKLNLFRVERDKLLKESDMYAIQDFPHKTPEIKEAWFNYRQALRDSTKDQILPSPP